MDLSPGSIRYSGDKSDESKRRNHSGQFKVKVALAVARGDKTIAELASEFGVHPTQVTQWKKQLLDVLPAVFSRCRQRDRQQQDELTAELYRQPGQLKVEIDWLKKNLDLTLEQKWSAIESSHRQISISRQRELLGLSHSSLCYEPFRDTTYNEQLMVLIDEQYL